MFKEKNNKKWFSHPALEIRESSIPNSGIGIFTNQDILAHTVIESSPVVIFHPNTFHALNDAIGGRHILSTYPFFWPDGNQAFAWGLGSLFQHKSVGCNVSWVQRDEGYNRIVFTTKVDVKKGEELFIKYATHAENLWFIDEEANMGHLGDDIIMDVGTRVMAGLEYHPYANSQRRPDNVETLASAMEKLEKKDK